MFTVQCGDVNTAELLFNTSKRKTLFMYGAIMKGKNDLLEEKLKF